MILRAVEAGEGGTGRGTPMVLLHGLFGQAANFATVQKRLAPARRVIALDLRNHGASPHSAAMDYAALAADVHETLATLGALPCALVGHSMGGKTAMRLALDAPEAVARLLVADIAPVPYAPAFRAYAAALRALPLVGLTRARADAALAETVPDRGVRGFLLQNLAFVPSPAWRIGLEEIAAGLPDVEAWPATSATYPGRTLFVAGARSDYIQPAHRPAIRALFPHAAFVTLKDSGHWLHSDNPDGFVALVEAFADG